jgi:hypothetical protein
LREGEGDGMSNFLNDRHNLYVGWVLGIALKNGVPAVPVVDEDGNFTDRLSIPIGDNNITVVVPEPPPEWTPL